MDQNESQRDKASRVARELSGALRRRARVRWTQVQTSQRNEGRRHVWRFQDGAAGEQRFLYVTHQALAAGENTVPQLMEQLEAGRWLDRLNEGPETSLVLSTGGRLQAGPPRA
ncbi:MAG TPA: hypothetical protein VFH27_04840 [Longimicrobiaceae bacterium]|nr:hypothetical protein [Longimicrobiaceae bacterium]